VAKARTVAGTANKSITTAVQEITFMLNLTKERQGHGKQTPLIVKTSQWQFGRA
jgi:hypothetical protein